MRDRYSRVLTCYLPLFLLSVRGNFLFKEEGADLIPKLRSLYCRVP
jgi:hypothetical protein